MNRRRERFLIRKGCAWRGREVVKCVHGGVGRPWRERCLMRFLLLSCANKKENEPEEPRQGHQDAVLPHS